MKRSSFKLFFVKTLQRSEQEFNTMKIFKFTRMFRTIIVDGYIQGYFQTKSPQYFKV